jgi:GMP synthase (glutamine-hydrolysing)
MAGPSVLVIQHAPMETSGIIAAELETRGMAAKVVRTFAGEQVPRELGPSRGLVVMGGPMSVYEGDRYPFLRDELRLIESAMRDDAPVLGVCLGSQLIAAALGAEVKSGGRKEIGWHAVKLTDDAFLDPLWKGIESSFPAFHWHGDVFTLPAGATLLASSQLTPRQAFRYGKTTYAILFHLEVTEGIVEAMVRSFSDELAAERLDGDAILRAAELHLPASMQRGRPLFARWASLVAAAVPPGA